METSIIEFAKGLLFLIPEIAVLAACIYYVAKNKSTDGILLMIGTFIGLCVMIFYRLIFPVMQYSYSGGAFSSSMIIVNVISFISFIGSVLFAIGLFMLVVKAAKKKEVM